MTLGSTQPPTEMITRNIDRAERDGTRPETRIRLSPKRTSPFKSVGASVQSTTGNRGVRINSSNGSNAGQTTFRGKVELYWLLTPFAFFPFTSPPVRHPVPPGSERALLPVEYRRPVRRADNLTTFMCQMSWNLGVSTSWNPQGVFRDVEGLLYLCKL